MNTGKPKKGDWFYIKPSPEDARSFFGLGIMKNTAITMGGHITMSEYMLNNDKRTHYKDVSYIPASDVGGILWRGPEYVHISYRRDCEE